MVLMTGRIRQLGRWFVAGLMAVILGGFTGCSGGGGGPETYPVKGKVVSQGGKPWAGGTISFRSVSDPSLVATGEIQPDGTFTLVTHYLVEGLPRTKPGALTGEYSVTVEEPGVKLDRDGNPSIPPLVLRKRYRVEAQENSFVIETGKPARP
jgi:hypothetical protein